MCVCARVGSFCTGRRYGPGPALPTLLAYSLCSRTHSARSACCSRTRSALQTHDVLSAYYGSAKRARRLAWDKAKKRSVFTQILNQVAPKEQVTSPAMSRVVSCMSMCVCQPLCANHTCTLPLPLYATSPPPPPPVGHAGHYRRRGRVSGLQGVGRGEAHTCAPGKFWSAQLAWFRGTTNRPGSLCCSLWCAPHLPHPHPSGTRCVPRPPPPPSPVTVSLTLSLAQSLLKFFEKHRRVVYVNEFRTSKCCAHCDQELRQVSNRCVPCVPCCLVA